jgi:hypothetical protein
MKKDNNITPIIVLILVIVATVAAIQFVDIGVDYIRKKLNLDTVNDKKVEEIVNIVDEVREQKDAVKYPDFSFYQEIKKINLVSNVESGVNQENEVYGRKYTKFIKTEGEIANAYLHVNVAVDNGKPLKAWDSVYVSLRKEENGYLYEPYDGHLLRGQSLPVPPSDTTVLLYDISSLPLVASPYSENNVPQLANWLQLIKSSSTFQFETFLSSQREAGEIIEISIGYECERLSPDCKLEVLEE